MGIAIGVAIVVAVLGLAVFIAVSRTSRHETGMTSFRKHIDALSPEARREVYDRVRNNEPDRDDDPPNSQTGR